MQNPLMVKNISPETLVIDLGKFNLLDIRHHNVENIQYQDKNRK